MSSREGPLATVPENGSFKVREVRAKEQKEQLLQMQGCSDSLGLEKGRHPAGKKAAHRVPGLAHALIKQEQYDGAGWDPQKPRGWISFLALPPCPVAQLPVGLPYWKAPARGWRGRGGGGVGIKSGTEEQSQVHRPLANSETQWSTPLLVLTPLPAPDFSGLVSTPFQGGFFQPHPPICEQSLSSLSSGTPLGCRLYSLPGPK